MNKYELAINDIRINGENIFERDVDTLQELVERATLKKVVFDNRDGVYSCPKCDAYNSDKNNYRTNNKYCPYCGQALDWSE